MKIRNLLEDLEAQIEDLKIDQNSKEIDNALSLIREISNCVDDIESSNDVINNERIKIKDIVM